MNLKIHWFSCQLHQLMPSVVTCLVARRLGNRFADNHWELRDFTANLVASICKRWDLPSCYMLCMQKKWVRIGRNSCSSFFLISLSSSSFCWQASLLCPCAYFSHLNIVATCDWNTIILCMMLNRILMLDLTNVCMDLHYW